MIKNISQYLGLRYAFALGLIFAVLSANFITFTVLLSTSEQDSYVVNISGMQRMLSQRIALMVREIENADNINDADIYAEKLSGVLNKMRSNHEQLTTGEFADGTNTSLSDEMTRRYFSRGGLDQKVSQYTDYTEQFLTVYREQGLQAAQTSPTIESIVSIARNGLLDELDQVVDLYEAEAKGRIAWYKALERIVYIIGVGLLVFEFLFIFRPITRAISETTSELKSRNNELVEFSYRISHDLRSPIKSVKGLMGLIGMASETGDTETVKTALGHSETALTKLETLTEDIIMLTKMKMTDIPDEPVDLTHLIDSSLKSQSAIEGFDRISFHKEIDVPCEILVKRMYLGQILENLISNAIKYQDQTIDHPHIKVMARVENSNCVIDVMDNGMGIPHDYRSKIFGMFQRFHPNQSFGSGLGLYLVAQNAKALGGDIKYYALPKGSQFTVTFPYQKAEEPS